MFHGRRPGARTLLAIAAGLVLQGCADTYMGPRRQSYSIEPAHQWAGGAVVMEALDGAFERGDMIVLGSETLAVFGERTDRIGLTLPFNSDGRLRLLVFRSRRLVGSAEVEAYGYSAMWLYHERMAEQITELPTDGAPAVVGPAWRDQDPNGGFVWIHPSTGAHGLFRGAPQTWGFSHTGVDPVTGDIYFEGRYNRVHVGRIVDATLRYRKWIDRPCDSWGCFPLAGDIWIVPSPGHTCKVVASGLGETCEPVDNLQIYWPRPQGIERLWSQDVALILHPTLPVFRLSTGEVVYTANEPPIYHQLVAASVVAAESHGAFYVSARTLESNQESRVLEILRLKGPAGELQRAFELTLTCPEEVIPPPRCSEPQLGYDPRRDVIFVVRPDTWTVEVRDATTTAVLGNIALSDHPDAWGHVRVIVDDMLHRAFVVFSASTRYDPATERYLPIPGTPVVEIRLPPG